MSINEMDSKVKELRELRRMAEELAAEIDSIQDSIKAHMDAQGVDTINGTDWKVTYKAVTSSRLDTAALKKALPDLAQQFTKTTSTRRFLVA
jgi:predicted phage-related endonuclease